MKILYVTSTNIWGGGTVALYRILVTMKERGHDVRVITRNTPGPFLQKMDEIGVEYYCTNIGLTIYPNVRNPLKWMKRTFCMLLRVCKEKRFIRNVIEKMNPDIVHTNLGPLSPAYDVCMNLGIPHVWHQREYQDLDFDMHFFPSVKTFVHKIKNRQNYNVAITKGVFNYRNMNPNKDVVIYDGVFSMQQVRLLRNVEKKDNYVLFAGRIEEAKCPYDLLVAFSKFHKVYPHVKLLLAGSYSELSDYYQKCKNFVDDNTLNEFVQFLGQRSDVYDLMSKALMLVVPSRFEGFGFITAEAMLNHCVVIGRNTAGTKEQFDNGLEYTGKEIGYRFDNNDSMYECMVKAMEENTADMVNSAYETVVHLYNAEKCVDEIETLYYKILDSNK